MQSIRALKLLLLLTALAVPLAFAQKRDEGEVVLVGTTDPDMVAAIRTARAELDGFLSLAASPPPETSGFKLKVVVRDGETVEHFWVTPFRPSGSEFEGVLANTPKIVRNVKNGQLLHFSRAEISDWGYVKNGRQVGSYTVCVLFKKMPKEQAEYYRKNHGFDC
jgi:uncharacterized protein YegJ (DUF2314 family)